MKIKVKISREHLKEQEFSEAKSRKIRNSDNNIVNSDCINQLIYNLLLSGKE